MAEELNNEDVSPDIGSIDVGGIEVNSSNVVVPAAVPPPPASTPAAMRVSTIDKGLEARWGQRLAVPFNPVSRFFLRNYFKLRPHAGARGLNSTEAMVIIHIMDHKWDSRAPFPAMTTLAERMGLSVRAVRAAVKRLDDLGYVRREPSPYGGPNRYHFDGLIAALHKLQDEEAAAREAEAAAAAATKAVA